jgi:hypothetical protein
MAVTLGPVSNRSFSENSKRKSRKPVAGISKTDPVFTSFAALKVITGGRSRRNEIVLPLRCPGKIQEGLRSTR